MGFLSRPVFANTAAHTCGLIAKINHLSASIQWQHVIT